MDVRLSSEQQALRDSVAQAVARLGPRAVGQLDDDERVAKLDAAVSASGWRELRTATDDGGPLASGVEAAIVAEQLADGLADTAYLGPTLAAELRRLAAAPPSASTETAALVPDLSAAARATGGTLSSGAVAIDAAGSSSALVLVPAADGNGYTLGEVTIAATPAVDQRVDLTRPSVTLDHGTTITPLAGQERVITDDDLARWNALALALTCADLVGVMRGAVRLSVDYASSRRQYGVAVGSFQAVQHLLADALVAMEGSSSITLHAAWAVDALPPDDALVAGAMAKAYSARAARTVCETAIQVHGGIGNTWECLAHVYLRRALLSSDVLGGTGPNLARVLAHHGIEGDHGLR